MGSGGVPAGGGGRGGGGSGGGAGFSGFTSFGGGGLALAGETARGISRLSSIFHSGSSSRGGIRDVTSTPMMARWTRIDDPYERMGVRRIRRVITAF